MPYSMYKIYSRCKLRTVPIYLVSVSKPVTFMPVKREEKPAGKVIYLNGKVLVGHVVELEMDRSGKRIGIDICFG